MLCSNYTYTKHNLGATTQLGETSSNAPKTVLVLMICKNKKNEIVDDNLIAYVRTSIYKQIKIFRWADLRCTCKDSKQISNL